MQLKQLEYLIVLERERHFGRAAQACNVSQSALSQALRSIEQEFGVPIVDRRNQGFRGFTPEGMRILEWARSVLADRETLLQKLGPSDPGTLTGHIRIGVIPVATPMVSLLTNAFCRTHPGITMSLLSQPYTTIERGLERFEIEVGVTYLDPVPRSGLRPYVLYDESYFLLAPEAHPVARNSKIAWRDAGSLPLCLLTPEMLNRQLLDGIFQTVGVTPQTVIETNCAVMLCSHVRSGDWFTIIPHTFFYLINGWRGTKAIPLVDPVATNTMGLVILERQPQPPIVNAFAEVVQSFDLASELKKYVPQ